MTSTEHKAQLRNAVRHKVAALTVVEVESRYRAEKLIEELKPILAERPYETIYFPEPTPSAGAFLQAARDAVRSWTPGEGVLFLVDAERIQPPDFWREMNSYRESWGALGCHVVFFLAPGNYRLLIQVADHLADWMPLKLHIFEEEDRQDKNLLSWGMPNLAFGPMPSPKVARDQLEVLQKELDEALTSGLPQPVLIRRYYLPMFQAALGIEDLHRAEAIRGRIKEEDVTASEKGIWFILNYKLDLSLYRLSAAEKWARRLLEATPQDDDIAAAVWHQLGVIAQRLWDFSVAEEWYRKSLEISERLGNESFMAGTYLNLGAMAEERRDLSAAEEWYRKSLEIWTRLGDESGMASTYHHLGTVAQKQWNLSAAEEWHHKSLEIKERIGDESGLAGTYHQLGFLAAVRRDLSAAEVWCHKSLEISKRLGNEFGIAITFHELGMIAQRRGDLSDAEEWYLKSLEIKKRLGTDSDMASTYHQLGKLAQELRFFTAAEDWYNKSIEISDRLGNVFGVALTLWARGGVALLVGKFEDASSRLADSYRRFIQLGDNERAKFVKEDIVDLYRQAGPTLRSKIKEIAEQAGIELPSEDESPPAGGDAEG